MARREPRGEADLGRIRVLDDHLVNRIAAGEVVERPASVVKELVENSLDAAATRIEIRLVGGGKRQIRVADDGAGMDRDDALLALERHATSKLSRFEDLDAIATLGFRGEALPSIAAVSRLLLRTAARDGEGTEVAVRAGRILAVRDAGVPRGTWIEVDGLFFNVPARRKFLRADATELGHVVRLIGRCALAHPDVTFRLEHEGRTLLDAPPARGAAERAAQVLGAETARRLVPFSLERGGVRAHGLAGRPADALPRRDAQHLFVNGRPVQDRILTHAVAEAYGNTQARDRFPALILFVEADPARVDVNAHPQKLEVRFAGAGEIHDLVREAVASALGRDAAIPSLADLRPDGRSSSTATAVLEYLASHEGPAEAGRSSGDPAPARDLFEPGGREDALPGPLVPLAQYRESYILAEDRDGVVVVDQHAAHERVLFERYLAEADDDRVEVQPLLFPVVVELAPHERVVLEGEIGEFRRLGLVVEPFGGGAVRLEAIPAVASGLDPARLLHELLGEAGRARSAATAVAPLRRRLVTTAACQAAIKVNHRLEREQMQALLDALARTKSPTTCPHGRPVLFRLTLEEVERAFRRR